MSAMTLYEIIIACVALTNLVLTLAALSGQRAKAASSRLEALETWVRGQLHGHDEQLQRLLATAEVAVTHDHLAELYKDIKALSQQVHTLVGQQQTMNENLRLLLAQLVRDHGGV